ncbi:YpbS family protein [Paenibacillus sp. WQ 127069]|uniref:YpbS family protein n=1 Tax=Paenibacillus baimaensis TaxID=2982185 RepID=A0ABT2UT95_9BACL|nr:YpbS family protein [Paenibacillus sp. WQ 127069]MCU6797782.1 YpbS family protein [Paenibacillus sp. WQ 127069]
MSVHEAITSHTQKMHAHLEVFQVLDLKREQAIDQAVAQYAAGEAFTVDEINRYAVAINEHAKHGISPTRTYITKDMLIEYVQRSRR